MKNLILFLLVFTRLSNSFDISSYGAIATPKEPDVSIANRNADALLKAFKDANDMSSEDRTVRIPPGKTYYFTGIIVENLKYSFSFLLHCFSHSLKN